MIPFNKPFLTGKEAHYMYQAVYTGKLSGNGLSAKNWYKAQRKAKFYINKCRSASCMQGGLKQASA